MMEVKDENKDQVLEYHSLVVMGGVASGDDACRRRRRCIHSPEWPLGNQPEQFGAMGFMDYY
jgi:hypothetical protein